MAKAKLTNLSTDVLIIGSEGAGARAAIAAADKGVAVTVVTKGYAGKSGSTLTAGADVDVDSRSICDVLGLEGDRRDSPEIFFEDILREGEYINNQRLVEIHVNEAPRRLKEMMDWGMKVDEIHWAPGHSYARGLWVDGKRFPRVLIPQLKKRPIRLIEHFTAIDVVVSEGRVTGVVGLMALTGELCFIQSKAVVLCTGGPMRIWSLITAPDETSGDGMAMAYRAGAELCDMEFPMFLPYCMIHPKSVTGNYFPYVMSYLLQGHALNRLGERYMAKYDPERMELSTRDINCVAAAIEIVEGRGSPHGGTYLSFKHQPNNLLDFSAEWFPPCLANWREGGFYMLDFMPDPKTDAIETGPCAHFFNGGIRINERCETTVPGLYAAGEGIAGVHGANRISGNAITMTQVWGHRAGLYAADFAKGASSPPPREAEINRIYEETIAPLERSKGTSTIDLRREIHKQADKNVWLVKKEEWLKSALQALEGMEKDIIPNLATRCKVRTYNREWQQTIEDRNMIMILKMIARTSLMRDESRGSLYRMDYPEKDNDRWLKNIVISKKGEEMLLATRDVDLTKSQPKRRGKMRYGMKG